MRVHVVVVMQPGVWHSGDAHLCPSEAAAAQTASKLQEENPGAKVGIISGKAVEIT
jgi:hypothetical protein